MTPDSLLFVRSVTKCRVDNFGYDAGRYLIQDRLSEFSGGNLYSTKSKLG